MIAFLRLLLLLTLSVLPAAAISVSGTLTTDGGAPMSGATVTVEQVGGELPPFTLTTGANGAYSVNHPLLFGNIRITPAKSGYRFDPAFSEVFTDNNLANKNFTGISLGQIAVAVVEPSAVLSQPAAVSFSHGAVDEETTLKLNVISTGSGPLTGLSFSFSGLNAADFGAVNTLPATLPDQGLNVASLIIAARPTAAGTRTADLNIYSSDSKENPFVISLSIEAWPSLRVSSLADSGPGSLRQAFANAAARPGQDSLVLDPRLLGGVVSLSSEISVNDPDGVSLMPVARVLRAETTFDHYDPAWQSASNISFTGDWEFHGARGTWFSAGQPGSLPVPAFRTARLTSPVFTVTQTGEQIVRFRHRHSFEMAGGSPYDGGQILASVDGGPFRLLTAFQEKGYTGIVSASSTAEIRGQPAFCGTSEGYLLGTMTESAVLLGALNSGQQITIMFLAAYDISVSPNNPAWEIDSVSLESQRYVENFLTIGAGGSSNRLLSNAPRSLLNLSNVILTGGRGSGSDQDGAGGALFNAGIATLSACTLYGNSSGGVADGGAVFNAAGGTLRLIRCTLTGNSCTGSRGGAVASVAGAFVSLIHCTVAGNSAWLEGGGIFEDGGMSMTNSIVAENRITGAAPNDIRAGGPRVLSGKNIVRAVSFAAGTATGFTALNADPLLAPLAFCGGPTPTMALGPGSPARDALTAAGTGSNVDQRGFPLQGSPDIGAYEANATVSNFNAYIRERVPAGSSLSPYAPDADFDFDGQNNEQEWLALTDPSAPGSHFDSSSIMVGGFISIRFEVHPARAYRLQQSDTLAPGSWIPAPGVAPIEAATGLRSFAVPVSGVERRFYRVVPSLPQ